MSPVVQASPFTTRSAANCATVVISTSAAHATAPRKRASVRSSSRAGQAEESASTVRFTMAARGQAVNESHEWSGARSQSGYAFATGAAYGSNTPVSRTSSSASWLFVSSRSACGSARSASTRFSASWW